MSNPMNRYALAPLMGLLLLAAPRAQQPRPEDMPQEMVWVDHSGHVTGRVGSVQNAMFYPELSPDDRFIAVSARDGEVNDRDIWIHDVATGAKRQVTSAKGNDNQPVWSPDGRKIAFTSSRTGNYNLYLKSIDSDTPKQHAFTYLAFRLPSRDTAHCVGRKPSPGADPFLIGL